LLDDQTTKRKPLENNSLNPSIDYHHKFKSPANEGKEIFTLARNSPQLHQQRKISQIVTDPSELKKSELGLFK
jgi:hypothetical protein